MEKDKTNKWTVGKIISLICGIIAIISVISAAAVDSNNQDRDIEALELEDVRINKKVDKNIDLIEKANIKVIAEKVAQGEGAIQEMKAGNKEMREDNKVHNTEIKTIFEKIFNKLDQLEKKQ